MAALLIVVTNAIMIAEWHRSGTPWVGNLIVMAEQLNSECFKDEVRLIVKEYLGKQVRTSQRAERSAGPLRVSEEDLLPALVKALAQRWRSVESLVEYLPAAFEDLKPVVEGHPELFEGDPQGIGGGVMLHLRDLDYAELKERLEQAGASTDVADELKRQGRLKSEKQK
jgi:hypothetical protein